MTKLLGIFLAGKMFRDAVQTECPYFVAAASLCLLIVLLTDAYDRTTGE